MKTKIRNVGAVLALLATASSPVFAHGGGSVKLASTQVAAGSNVRMVGEKLGKTESFRVELRGVLNKYAAGSVQSTDAGVVTADIAIPAAVRPGAYTLVLLAGDGDVAARTEVNIEAAGPAGAAGAPAHQMAGPPMESMATMHATAEMMDVDVNTTSLEWAVIGLLLLASVAGGTSLILRSGREA